MDLDIHLAKINFEFLWNFQEYLEKTNDKREMSAPEMWSRVKVYPRVAQDPSRFQVRGFYAGTTDAGTEFGVRRMPGYDLIYFPVADFIAVPDRDPAPGVYEGGKRQRRTRRRTTRHRRTRRGHTRRARN
jgi:hypothetical protein